MAMPEGVLSRNPRNFKSFRPRTDRRVRLVAMAGAYRYALAASCTPTAQYGCTRFRLHTRTKTVSLGAVAPVGLKGALGHKMLSCFLLKILAIAARFKYIEGLVRNPAAAPRDVA
jgi:hypothetical protein